MPRDIVARRKNGKLVTWYVTIDGRRVALRTKDAIEARRRARLARAGQWPPPEEDAARVSEGAFAFGGRPAPVSDTPPPVSGPAPEPIGDWTSAATGASADTAAPPLDPDVMPPAAAAEEAKAKAEAEHSKLADLAVTAQIELTTFGVRQKVYRAFVPPPMPPEGRAVLAGEYKKIFDYAGAAIQLPPWVLGVLLPAATILGAAVVIGRGYADEARKQKQAAAQPTTTSYQAQAA